MVKPTWLAWEVRLFNVFRTRPAKTPSSTPHAQLNCLDFLAGHAKKSGRAAGAANNLGVPSSGRPRRSVVPRTERKLPLWSRHGLASLLLSFACLSCASTETSTTDAGPKVDVGVDAPSDAKSPRPPKTTGTIGEQDTFTEVEGGTEGITFLEVTPGEPKLYVGGNEAIWEIGIDGVSTKTVDVKGPLGLAPRDGKILACAKTDDGKTAIYLVDPAARSKTLLVKPDPSFGLLNFVLADRDGSLLFTDSEKDKVYRAAADGSGVTAIADIDYANGLALAPDFSSLYVASYNQKRVMALSRTPTGWSTPTVLAEGVPNVDGLVTLPSGGLLFVGGEGVQRYEKGKVVPILSGKSLKIAANGAMGKGVFGSQWLYVSTLIGTTIERIYIGP